MNHRELILSARKKAKFHFLQLPESVQDDLIDRLDGGTITLEGARDFLREQGHTLSHEAIAGYYRAVRRERRLYDATQELTRVVEQFRGGSIEEGSQVLANFLIATAVRQLADGELAIKPVDLGKVLQAVMKGQPPASSPADAAAKPSEEPAARKEGGGKELARETIEKIRRDVYGIV